jgi:hypothetical protein
MRETAIEFRVESSELRVIVSGPSLLTFNSQLSTLDLHSCPGRERFTGSAMA